MSHTRTKCFDGWVLRVDVGELEKDGRKIRLQDQPLQILDELLTQPGELVTREQLIARLWPKGVVDFDTGLNSAVRKLRIALGDEADTPRYIATVPRKGYRFIGPIDPPQARSAAQENDSAVAASATAATVTPASDAPKQDLLRRRHSDGWRSYIYVAAALAGVLIAAAVLYEWRRESAPMIVEPATQSQDIALDARKLAVLPLRSAASDDESILLAQSLTDLIRNRLATFEDLVVIASSSTAGLNYSPSGTRAIGEKLRARFLLAGGVERVGEQLRVNVRLVDAQSGKEVWSSVLDGPLAAVARIREEIFQRVADVLHATADPDVSSVSAHAAISLDAYQLYMRGQALLASERLRDCETAIELFQRATILDPGFARAYLGLGQAQLLAISLTGSDETVRTLAEQRAFDRALELNPALGEAWIERARSTRDPVAAEALYRKGIEHAPNYGAGYANFANFLFRNGRTGEAIDMVDRARAIDPLTPVLHLRQAFLEMVARSDVAVHDRLVHEALAINPTYQPALYQLTESRWEYSSEFADAARVIERAIALDPDSGRNRSLATRIYLDLAEPESAIAVREKGQNQEQAVDVAQYQRDPRRAAQLARALPVDAWWTLGENAMEAEAIRDDALLGGDHGAALALLESGYAAVPTGAPRIWTRYLAMVYAHMLMIAGEVERGRKLAASTLVLIDSHSVGRAEHWFARDRAAGYMVLGDEERALEELAAAVRTKRLYRWWYTFELDPLFEPVRRDPRFIALAEQARKHNDEQRVLLEDMRRKGEIPSRGS